jgi:MFS family permease
MQSKNRIFILCLLVTFFQQAYFSVFFLYPAMLRQQGYAFSTIGWLLSIFSIATTATRPFAGIVTERYGFRNTIIASSFAMVVSALPLLFLKDSFLILLVRLLMGVFFSISMVAVSSYQSLAVPIETRGKLFGWISIGYVLPQVVLLPIWEYQVTHGHFIAYLAFPPLLAILAGVASFFLPKISRAEREKAQAETEHGEWGRWEDLFRLPPFWILQISAFLFGFINSAVLQYMPALFNTRDLIASFFIVSNDTMAITLGFAIMIMGVALQFVLLCGSNAALVFGGFFYGIGMGFGFPIILALMPDVIPRNLRPKGISMSFLTIDVAFIICPLVIGYTSALLRLDTMMHIFGYFAAIAGPLLYFAFWRRVIKKESA